jgi:hypothetical protein
MPIESDEELVAAIRQAGTLLQDIQDYVGRDFSKVAKVRFPRGFLRTAAQARERLGFLERSHFKSNVSYALMLSDVQHWLLSRTDLSGTAKEMVIKLQIFLLGNVVESLTKVRLRGECGGNYKRRTAYLVQQETITADLKTERWRLQRSRSSWPGHTARHWREGRCCRRPPRSAPCRRAAAWRCGFREQ